MSRLPHQLPPGRHGLPRSFVAQNQRERILAAVAEVTSERGYGGLTIEHVIASAGVSRRTFYEHFDNKHGAFLAAYDEAARQIVEQVSEAVAATDGLVGKVHAGLAAFLDFIVREPAFARMCIVEVLAAGPEAMNRRGAAMQAFARLIDGTSRELLGDAAPPALTAETIVGGIYEVVFARIHRDQVEDLPSLLGDLAYSALLPYVGPQAAAAERLRVASA